MTIGIKTSTSAADGSSFDAWVELTDAFARELARFQGGESQARGELARLARQLRNATRRSARPEDPPDSTVPG